MPPNETVPRLSRDETQSTALLSLSLLRSWLFADGPARKARFLNHKILKRRNQDEEEEEERNHARKFLRFHSSGSVLEKDL